MKKHQFFYFFLVPALFFCACSNPNTTTSSTEATAPSVEKVCINKVIEVDAILGAARNHACEKISLSQTIKEYSKGIDNIDFAQCPKKFTTAFKKHQTAWLNMLMITDKYPDLRGEMHDLFKQLEETQDAERFKILLKDIWDTWAEVEQEMLLFIPL